MNWNLILFVAKWAAIVLFYAILLVLVVGVYREMSRGAPQEKPVSMLPSGRLRIVSAGDDYRIMPGMLLDLKTENRLGAEKDNDIILRDSYVSGYHAYIRWDGSAWWIEDLNSRNGTRVNQQPIPPRVPRRMNSGAILHMGDVELEFVG
jgi:hypothetical protein